ncbi:50S ribosomal protein L11 methyltransferase [Sporolactobacillus terrae]|uniref:Ribosomal protein L11 methyltransferase n=1 Tax=Sporolactobacillus terrae TaxID=269673 RepID=A0ABX5Q894_9BACL|nr:50S ribosomal protein L11 methyltransferase [Sporolactobacillus terrae]QAA22841.1 50S ribosomal protein L11 methyltransferase [Sporolactobacillus terrae]QAA25815.1 50S ribosomal protein L11 methyltransferase [Sporolactobacillus terrae]UAK17691.1 50S ribosomal protein L11 methyltransferase [Sporolactobacillus terrae]
MRWSEICIHTTEEAIESVTNILYEAGAGGVVIEDSQDLRQLAGSDSRYSLDPADYPIDGVNVKAYLPINSFLGETVEEIKQSLNNLVLYDIDLGDGQVTLSEHNEEEWATAWKKYYKPVEVGRWFYISPTWESFEPRNSERQVIELDPGMAFGTGTHPTTVLCIEALEKYLPNQASVLDVGTGTGVLSIAAAKLGADEVMAVDLDAVAVQSAKINVKLNHVQDVVKVRQNNLSDHVTGTYQIVVANLLAELVIRLAESGVGERLDDGGRLIASGIIKQKKAQVVQTLSKNGLRVIDSMESGDWVALIAEKAE